MDLICPRHKIPLRITEETISVFGNTYAVVTGICHKCSHKYINQAPFSNCTRFEIEGQVYQYSDILHSAYPPSKNVVQEEIPKKTQPSKKSVSKKKPAKSKPQKMTQKKARDIEIEKMKERILNDDYDRFHATRVYFAKNLPKECVFDGEELIDVKRVVFEKYGVRVKAHSSCCLRCNSVYLTMKKRDELLQRIKTLQNNPRPTQRKPALSTTKLNQPPNPTPVDERVSTEPLPFEKSEKENISEKGVIVQVYPQKCHCSKCEKKYGQNTMSNKTAVVNTLDGQTVDINVMFCKGCGQYFISAVILKMYQKRYGGLLVELTPYEKNLSNQYSIYGFNPDTVLSRCGYSVAKGIPRSHRQAVLTYVLESGKALKYEIIEIISGFLKFRENRENFADACERWREDIRFVSEYQMNSQKKIYNPRFVPGKR